jgi:3-hydroxyisobutyrate dehydrogenase-like beta-hydroxyacid dehydrogenase
MERTQPMSVLGIGTMGQGLATRALRAGTCGTASRRPRETLPPSAWKAPKPRQADAMEDYGAVSL